MRPPLNALRAFEAAARHLSVSRAAEELHVTQPAVSQQIKQLEAFLEVRLLRHGGGRIALTDAGRGYAVALTRAFAEIAEATSGLLSARAGGVLTVTLLPTFAMRWLIPRLPSFHAAHPEIEVRLSTTARLVDLPREDVDVAIRFGDGRWAKLQSEFLMANDAFPVASPALLDRLPLDTPGDLARHTLLHVDREQRRDDWRHWLAAAGAPEVAARTRMVGFESSSQALEAAAAGLGIAIGHRPFVADDLATGRLAAPFAVAVESPGAYYIVSTAADAMLPRIRSFRDWLLAEANAAHSDRAPSGPNGRDKP